jgi:ubiquitin fusion degradation protein 1
VLEFTAPEGTAYLPYWMMSNLTLTEGRRIKIRNVSLPKATFVKFQPQSVDFLEISNPRAVLEYKLRSFSCVTVGDHLAFTYNDQVRDIHSFNRMKPERELIMILDIVSLSLSLIYFH